MGEFFANVSYVMCLQYMPPVDSRSCAGFVGLKNGGATCYMNSLLQQLYMIPGIPESILSIDDELVGEERLFIRGTSRKPVVIVASFSALLGNLTCKIHPHSRLLSDHR